MDERYLICAIAVEFGENAPKEVKEKYFIRSGETEWIDPLELEYPINSFEDLLRKCLELRKR